MVVYNLVQLSALHCFTLLFKITSYYALCLLASVRFNRMQLIIQVEFPGKSTFLHRSKMIDTTRNVLYRTAALGLLDLRSSTIKSTSASAASTICSGGYWAFHPIKLPCRGVNVHLSKLIFADPISFARKESCSLTFHQEGLGPQWGKRRVHHPFVAKCHHLHLEQFHRRHIGV